MKREKIKRENIIKVIQETENVLVTTHNKLCLPIINRIYNKMINGIKFDDIKVFEKVIIDGHHRYVSSLLANIKAQKAQSKTSPVAKKVYKQSTHGPFQNNYKYGD